MDSRPCNQPNPDYSPDLTLPATNQNWPEEFGFTLGGAGPSYILSVIEGSSAYLAGLQPGDQVVDIEGQEVSSLRQNDIHFIVFTSNSNLTVP
uniref:PDZ domain-containing protein n=1 Tax=Oncorhynchus mykiss TaxID=8022 RepID=A0A8C7QSK0_ONCMY